MAPLLYRDLNHFTSHLLYCVCFKDLFKTQPTTATLNKATKAPATISNGQCTPAATRAIPIRTEPAISQMPNFLLIRKTAMARAKNAAACPEGKAGVKE